MRIVLVAALLLSACVHETECRAGAVERDGVCVRTDAVDAGISDAGRADARADGGGDAGTVGMCDDGVACTTDTAVDGGCESTPSDVECASEIPCAVGRCDPEAGCLFTYEDSMCPESTCNSVRCDEADGCTYTPLPDSTSCDDGIFCNGADTCQAGACDSPGDPCPGMSVCDEGVGECTGCAGDGDCPEDETVFSACSYADGCSTTGMRTATTTRYSCDTGRCVSTRSTMTVSSGCARATDGNSCDSDGEFCTNDVCDGGRCTHPRLANDTPCTSDGDVCTRDVCRMGACIHPELSDGTSCPGGYCCSGGCVAPSNNRHCGVCGMDCTAEGQTCTNAISNNGGRHNLPGAYVCTCPGSNFICQNIGYGPSATCFDGHCQCQCATSPSSCGGQCSAGSCFENTIEPRSDNFCAY